MKGKYRSLSSLLVAYAARQYTRFRIRNAVEWNALGHLEDGCTAIIGMPHRLPGVLIGNLRCLWQNRWPELKKVIIVVDSTPGCLPEDIVYRASTEFFGLPIEFAYYSDAQVKITDKMGLGYVYSWLSWCIGLGLANTKHVLVHDYDALIIGSALSERYKRFSVSGALIQGISWYQYNGIEVSDRLATTFEAFLDLAWVRQFEPIMLFNQVAIRKGRSRDYDTLLEVQEKFTLESAKDIELMGARVISPSITNDLSVHYVSQQSCTTSTLLFRSDDSFF